MRREKGTQSFKIAYIRNCYYVNINFYVDQGGKGEGNQLCEGGGRRGEAINLECGVYSWAWWEWGALWGNDIIITY